MLGPSPRRPTLAYAAGSDTLDSRPHCRVTPCAIGWRRRDAKLRRRAEPTPRGGRLRRSERCRSDKARWQSALWERDSAKRRFAIAAVGGVGVGRDGDETEFLERRLPNGSLGTSLN